MKRILMCAALAVCGWSARAQQAPSAKDTLVVNRPNRVVVVKTDSLQSIRIEGNEQNDGYLYFSEMRLAPNSSLTESEQTDRWDFSLPFQRKTSHSRNSISTSGLGIGLNSAVGAPDAMNVTMGAPSYEIFLLSGAAWSYCPWSDSRAFSVGLGVNWKNYRMTGNTRFVKGDDGLTLEPYPTGAKPKFSRLKIFSLTLPFMYSANLGSGFNFQLGPVVNFNLHSSVKTRYTLDGKDEKETGNGIHPNRVTLDLMGIFRLHSMGVYVKYSPSNVLDTNYGPKFRSFSVGLILL